MPIISRRLVLEILDVNLQVEKQTFCVSINYLNRITDPQNDGWYSIDDLWKAQVCSEGDADIILPHVNFRLDQNSGLKVHLVDIFVLISGYFKTSLWIGFICRYLKSAKLLFFISLHFCELI